MVSLPKDEIDIENQKIANFVLADQTRKTVVVQGVGFVGAAMLIALSNARDSNGCLLYNVIGLDLQSNFDKLQQINNGICPTSTLDPKLTQGYLEAQKNGNLLATYSEYAYQYADSVVIDVNLDIIKSEIGNARDYKFNFDVFSQAIKSVADNITEDTVVLLETTVPPGTTGEVVVPIFEDAFAKRKLDISKVYIGYSFERVMPGINYLDSITNNNRVYSANSEKSKRKIKNFLESFINIDQYPLHGLHSTTAAEVAKVLENSFRAMNIAFIQEWTEFSHDLNINLYDVINAIRARPTHKNIMYPGFGVGGYCLTKDSLLADWSLKNFTGSANNLEMSLTAVEINDMMPLYTLKLLKSVFPHLNGLNISILGLSYLPGVADTRYSPTELFYEKCIQDGAKVNVHDPMVTQWTEKDMQIICNLESFAKSHSHDVVVFAIGHNEYSDLTAEEISTHFKNVKLVIDGFNVLSDRVALGLSKQGVKVLGVGKGHWNNIESL